MIDIGQYRLLLIDDDLSFGGSLAVYFQNVGIAVSVVSDGEMTDGIDLERFSAILLDIDMPGRPGLDTLRAIRSRSEIPVIMVSCHSEERWRIDSLALGADFFLPKPLSLGELELVVRNLVFRDGRRASNGLEWTLRRNDLSLVTPNGERIGLTALEFGILERLITRSNKGVPRETLVDESIRKRAPTNQSRSVDVMISRLKKQCQQAGHQLPVKSVRNLGYVFHSTGRVID